MFNDRTKFLLLGLVLGLAVSLILIWLSIRGTARAARPVSPDLILYNGKIYTVDKNFSVAEAVAIYGERLIAVGRNDEVKRLAGDRTRRVDLQGKTVIPGLIDNHTHMILAGLEAKGMDVKVDLTGSTSIADIVKRIEEKVKVTPPGEWIVADFVWHPVHLKEKRPPNRWDLDPVSPNHPVYIPRGGKDIILNSYALKLGGITKYSQAPPGGEIYKDPKTGEPTGYLTGTAADVFRQKILAKMGKKPIMWDFLIYPPEAKAKGLKLIMREYNAAGVTSTRDMGVSQDEIKVYQDLWKRGELTVRTNLIIGIPSFYLSASEIRDIIQNWWGPTTGFGDHMLNLGGIKIVAEWTGPDGVGRPLPEDRLRTLIIEGNRQGWQLNIHAKEQVEKVLEILEEADRERPIAGRRFSLEHGFFRRSPEFYQRIKRLGLIVAAQGGLFYHYYGWWERNATPEERKKSPVYPVKDWIDAGLIVTNGTDNPAVPSDQMLAIWAFLTRMTATGVLAPDQAITREEALRMHTINGAYATFEENIKGSIEVGKLADLVVISDDIMTVAVDKIKEIKVLATIVGGKVVYKAEGTNIF